MVDARMVRNVARFMALQYSDYVRKCVAEGEVDLIESGIDTDFDTYRSLYRSVMASLLGYAEEEPSWGGSQAIKVREGRSISLEGVV